MPIFRKKKTEEDKAEPTKKSGKSGSTQNAEEKPIAIPPTVTQSSAPESTSSTTSPQNTVRPFSPTVPTTPAASVSPSKPKPLSPTDITGSSITPVAQNYFTQPLPSRSVNPPSISGFSPRIPTPSIPDLTPSTDKKPKSTDTSSTAAKFDPEVITELSGVITTGGQKGLKKVASPVKKHGYDREAEYTKIADDYYQAGKKHEELELWQPGALDYVLAAAAKYLATNSAESAIYFAKIIKSTTFDIRTTDAVQHLRSLFEHILTKNKANSYTTLADLLNLPFQYREDISLMKTFADKVKVEIEKFE